MSSRTAKAVPQRKCLKQNKELLMEGMLAQAFNPSSRRQKQVDFFYKFEVSLGRQGYIKTNKSQTIRKK